MIRVACQDRNCPIPDSPHYHDAPTFAARQQKPEPDVPLAEAAVALFWVIGALLIVVGWIALVWTSDDAVPVKLLHSSLIFIGIAVGNGIATRVRNWAAKRRAR